MKSLFTFLFLATACSSVHGQVHHGNGTISPDDDDTGSTSKVTYSSLGTILLLALIGYLIYHVCKHREREPPPQRLQNEDEDPNNQRPRRRRRWWYYRHNRNYYHQNPNVPPNVVVQPVLNVSISPRDMNPPVDERMFGDSGTPNVPPPAYSESSDNKAPNFIPQVSDNMAPNFVPRGNCAMQTNYGYAPNFNQQPPAGNANNPPFSPGYRPTNINATAHIETQNNHRFAPNRY